MIKQSLHVHSTYDDGVSTMEEMVLSAIENGLSSMGFSGHSYLSFGEDWTMTPEETSLYCDDIDRLRAEYPCIAIYRGIELDTFSDMPEGSFQYIIGSCHNVAVNGYIISVDESKEGLIAGIDEYFGGDSQAFARAFFDETARIRKADIQGHFDLLTKFNEDGEIFDEKDYFEYCLPVMHKAVSLGRIFEINTGAVSRGYRSMPYPSERLLKALREMGGKITITADCHNAADIAFGYEEAGEYAKSCGFEKIWILTDSGFAEEKIR